MVNPRPTNEEFTKYSFPSKTLEYMASGTPLASTKLDGIPEEYDEYILWLKDETVKGIGTELNRIMLNEVSWLHEFGLKGRKWVVENKTENYQTKKILDFIEKNY